jgi:hypothetical protein
MLLHIAMSFVFQNLAHPFLKRSKIIATYAWDMLHVKKITRPFLNKIPENGEVTCENTF